MNQSFKPESMYIPSETEYDQNPTEELISRKHQEYTRNARRFRWLYYFTRATAGLSAGVLPFVVTNNPAFAVALSLAIVVATVFDSIFRPKDKWALYSKASDVLTIRRLKIAGEYKKYKEAVDLLFETEAKLLGQLVPLGKIIAEAQQSKMK